MCIFCDIAEKKLNAYTIYEDEQIIAILDINPANIGHTLIIPKKHFNNILDIDEDLLKRMIVVAKKIASVIASELSPEGINLLQNNNPTAGQVIEHFHIHIIPRWNNDQVTIHWQPQKLTNEELEKIAKILNEALDESSL